MTTFRSTEILMGIFNTLSTEERANFLARLAEETAPKPEYSGDEVQKQPNQLEWVMGAFVPEDERDAFMLQYAEKAKELLDKAYDLGCPYRKLEFVYIPADVSFQDLLDKFHKVRQSKGYAFRAEGKYEPLWVKKASVFGNYGIKETPQLSLMVNGDGADGLWLTEKKVSEQIAQKPKGLDFLTPVAYICANIARAANGNGSFTDLLDFNKGDWTATRFPQYSQDGFIKTGVVERYVPDAYLRDGGQLSLGGSDGYANWYVGVRLSVGAN